MFEISRITNRYLKDIATIADENNDGVISGEKEISIFAAKSRRLLMEGMVTENECNDVYIKNKNSVVNQQLQSSYKQDLEEQIDEVLKSKSLKKTPENINKALNILKRKKEISIEIEIHENRLKDLKSLNPRDKYANRTSILESVGATSIGAAGLFAGGFAGFKAGVALGLTTGPIGATIGACVGAVVGMGAGIYFGNKLGESMITDEEIKKAQQKIEADIKKESIALQKLTLELNSL